MHSFILMNIINNTSRLMSQTVSATCCRHAELAVLIACLVHRLANAVLLIA